MCDSVLYRRLVIFTINTLTSEQCLMFYIAVFISIEMIFICRTYQLFFSTQSKFSLLYFIAKMHVMMVYFCHLEYLFAFSFQLAIGNAFLDRKLLWTGSGSGKIVVRFLDFLTYEYDLWLAALILCFRCEYSLLR